MTAINTRTREFEPKLCEIERTVQWVKGLTPGWVDKSLLDAGLTEALTNAIVHGALEVTSDGRQDNLEDYLARVHRASDAPGSRAQQLTLAVEICEKSIALHLTWPGAACPPELREPNTPQPLRGTGLGLGIIHSAFHSVEWGADGRSLLLTLDKNLVASNTD